MKVKSALVVLALVAVSAAALTGVAGAGQAARTTVTIEGPQGDFQGTILSDDVHCLGGRTVRVFMQTQEGEPFQRIASDTSERHGRRGEWSVGNTGFRDGSFYARATKAPGCRAGRSPTIVLVNGEPQ